MSALSRRAILYLLITASSPAAGQSAGPDALEAQKRALEAERLERLKQKSVDEAQRDLAKPIERKRDARACEAARVEYQVYCGSPAAPRWRSPRCRDAEISMLYSC